MKFPFVKVDGTSVARETVDELWSYLAQHGWTPVHDKVSNGLVGATLRGEHNDTVASCETGFCKVEFSLAHVVDLHQLSREVAQLIEQLQPFMESNDVRLLGYGIQPITPPSYTLLMKKARANIWDTLFRSNRVIAPEHGHDLHMFTINAATHVHLGLGMEEMVKAVNVLNGFAGAQIALTANSNVWCGKVDPQFNCVAEKFWDWWMVEEGDRVGVPRKPFKDISHYIETVSRFSPVYVERLGKPILIRNYATFEEYYSSARAKGTDLERREVSLIPKQTDVDLHNTFYWYDARISRYYTVENRTNDEQPPEDLICIAALTLGLVNALDEAWEELSGLDWKDLRESRDKACKRNAFSVHYPNGLFQLAKTMLDLAQIGLERRGLQEQDFLAPLEERLNERHCPADQASLLFAHGGISSLVGQRAISPERIVQNVAS